jgi:hypothetical protein
VTAQDFSGYQTPDISVQNSRVNEDATSWLDSVDISLLTCGPGNEDWSYYGHTALRIQDKMHGSDVAVNWGMFSFRKSFFILRFVFGLTDYQIGIYPMTDFLAEYAAEGRWVRQQRINLSRDEKINILHAIEENAKPENDVAQIRKRTEDGQQSVWIRLEKRLRQELTRKQHDECGENGIACNLDTIIQTSKDGIIKQTGYQDTIYYEGYIVAHQHGADESVGMIIKERQESLRKSVFLLVHFRQHTVGGDEGNFHSTKECRKHHRDEDTHNQTYINFFHDTLYR